MKKPKLAANEKRTTKLTRYANAAKPKKPKVMVAAGNSYAVQNEADQDNIFMTPRSRDGKEEVSPIRVIGQDNRVIGNVTISLARSSSIERDY